MKTLIFVALLFSVVFAAPSDEEQFSAWIREHNRAYTPTEYPLRLRNFRETLTRIRRMNDAAPSGGASFGINKFSDLSEQEWKDLILMKPQNLASKRELEYEHEHAVRATPPPTFDWRNNKAVTPVKDQGQCGSCWAFSATECIESAWILANKSTNAINLSPQQMVDCDTSNNACNGGWPDNTYRYIKTAGGQVGVSRYAYTATKNTCTFNSAYIEARLTSFKAATTSGDETTLKNNLVAWGPLSICLDASQWNSYKGGVMTPAQACPSGTCTLNHCVQLVGYNTTATPPYWIVRNSWNTWWGNAGYINLQMGGNTASITAHATWVVI